MDFLKNKACFFLNNIIYVFSQQKSEIIDKNSLFDGVSIERLILCVKTKAITRCRTMSCASFERKHTHLPA